MLGARGGSDQDRLVALAMKLIADVLARWPLVGGGQRRRQPHATQPFIVVEERDPVQIHAPAPEISRQRVRGWQARSGQGAVPLGPGGRWLIGEIPGRHDPAMLPAAVGRVGRLVERIGVVRDVADEDAADWFFVDVEVGHLRDGHAFEGGDQPGNGAVVSVADRVDRTPVVEAADRFDQPGRDVADVHHVS